MRNIRWCLLGGVMFGLGWLAGGANPLGQSVSGQDTKVETAADKVVHASRAVKDAADALAAESKYETVTEGVNSFLVLAGGGNGTADLDAGVVDPETFAALYAGAVKKEVKDQLQKDADGRLTYNGNVIRMYSKSRLEKIFAERSKSPVQKPE